MNDEYNSGTAYRAMLKLFREARKEMEEEKFIPKRPSCLRCKDRKRSLGLERYNRNRRR